MLPNDNSVYDMIGRYVKIWRAYQQKKAELETQFEIDIVKRNVMTLLKDGGKRWTDEIGYAEIRKGSTSIGFDPLTVERTIGLLLEANVELEKVAAQLLAPECGHEIAGNRIRVIADTLNTWRNELIKSRKENHKREYVAIK